MAAGDPVHVPSPVLRRLQRGLALRASPMLVTAWGDAFAPRRQAIWLGSLIRLCSMFGLSDRLVRTSVFRLAADDWLQAERQGRRSYYGLSPQGLQRVAHADRRIYEFNLPRWDGHWTLVLLRPGLRASARAQLQRELRWESFGRVAPNVFAHPHVDLDTLRDILLSHGAAEHAAVLRAESLEGPGSGAPLQALMRDTFDLARVEAAWSAFVRRFQPLADEADLLAPADACMARLLLIHEYRRVLLRDPNLPEAFLPPQWPGVRARALCEALYRALLPASEDWLRREVQTLDGPLAPMPASMRGRLAPR